MTLFLNGSWDETVESRDCQSRLRRFHTRSEDWRPLSLCTQLVGGAYNRMFEYLSKTRLCNSVCHFCALSLQKGRRKVHQFDGFQQPTNVKADLTLNKTLRHAGRHETWILGYGLSASTHTTNWTSSSAPVWWNLVLFINYNNNPFTSMTEVETVHNLTNNTSHVPRHAALSRITSTPAVKRAMLLLKRTPD